MEMSRTTVFKLLYGFLFVCMVPALLVTWAIGTRGVVHVNAVQSQMLGFALAGTGALATAMGMLSLKTRGGGLPMNAFPPVRFVTTGIYGLIPHPIYGGFVLLCAGVAIVRGSASGLWLITPVVAMASAALVLGYELPDLRNRFGPQDSSVWMPRDVAGTPTVLERFRTYLTVLLPWLVAYECVIALGIPSDAVESYFPFEKRLAVIPWTEAIYASAYLVVLVAPLLIRSRRALRIFIVRGLSAIALVIPIYLLLPVIATPRPFVSGTALGTLLSFERTVDSAAAAFPSFHVVWALIAASALGQESQLRRWIWYSWAVLVSVSCMTTGMHSLIDVLGGFVAFAVVVKLPTIWVMILGVAERIANSWKEWRLGPVRIINHGAYAGAATFLGMCLISAIVGTGSSSLILAIYLGATVGAAMWAQWVEGSPALLRPLGFYGGMIGSIIGALAAPMLGISLWVTLAAICVAAPFIQGIGRLRCLVQGCCHGCATENTLGIRYVHPRSRVCRLSSLMNVPVHATPVYSILWNGFVGFCLLRLTHLRCSTALIAGIYLMLSGIGRFVEEAYRGEPQTTVVGGLRLYQWLAVASTLAGAALTMVRSAPAIPAISREPAVAVAALCGFAAWFVTGIDFPESSRRFARLT